MTTNDEALRTLTTLRSRERHITWLTVGAWALGFVPHVGCIAPALLIILAR